MIGVRVACALLLFEAMPGGRTAYRVAALVIVAAAIGTAVAWITAPAERALRPDPSAPVRDLPGAIAPRPGDPAPAELPIAGWVIDGEGAAIAGVQVTARDAAGVPVGAGDETDEDGAFRIELPTAGTIVLEGPHVFPAEVRWQAGGPPPRILLSRRISIDVRVTAGGAPVEDAEVHVSDGSSPTLETALTGADGIARFDDLQAGPYELWARRDRTVSALVRTVHGGGADPLDRVELVLEPGGAVHGRVSGAGLDPTTATVRLVPVGVDHAVRIATLDPQGGFAIDGVPFGRWRAEAEAPGWFQSGGLEVDVAGAPEEIELRLERTGVVSGTVVDGAGAPVADANVVLRAQGPLRLGRSAASLRTHAGMHDPPTLRWIHPLAGQRLMPWRDFGRFGAPREGPRPAECGRGHCGIDLGGKRGAVVHAAADGIVALVFTEIRKEAGRYVAIDHPGGLRSYYMHLDDIRADLEIGQPIRGGDPLGTVGRTGVVKDAPHLHFSIAQERGERTWYIDPEPILQHAVVLPVARALEPPTAAPTVIATTGRAVYDTAPTVTAEKAVTDAYGRFRLEGVAPGEYVAVAFHAELAPGASDRFTVRAGEETSGVRIALTPGVIVHGRVLGLHGAIAGARIVAEEGFGETSHKVATAFTDARGDYTLRSLAGKVSLTVSAAGHGEVTRAVALDGKGRKGDRHREDFDLVLEDARLTGEILDPEGHAAPAVEVRIVDGPSRQRRTVSDARGQFTIEGVAAGSYVVELASPAHPRMRANLRTGRHAELRLEQGGALTLELRDAHTAAALAGIPIDADGPGDRTAGAVTDTRGLAGLTGLSPGAWTLRVRADGYIAAEKRVEVAAARVPREVRIELSRGATLAGVVRDRYGRRVSGATVSAGGVTTRTDVDGNFRLGDVPIGTVEVVAEHDDGAARGAITLELAPGDEHLTLKLEVLD